MIKVADKKTNEILEVYDIKYDKNGYPHFLIYKNGQWLVKSAKNYKPSC